MEATFISPENEIVAMCLDINRQCTDNDNDNDSLHSNHTTVVLAADVHYGPVKFGCLFLFLIINPVKSQLISLTFALL